MEFKSWNDSCHIQLDGSHNFRVVDVTFFNPDTEINTQIHTYLRILIGNFSLGLSLSLFLVSCICVCVVCGMDACHVCDIWSIWTNEYEYEARWKKTSWNFLNKNPNVLVS